MKVQAIFGASALIAIIGFSAGFVPREAAPEAAPAMQNEQYAVDAVHSSVVFKIMHMGVANFYGRFNSIEGSYTLGSDDPAHDSFRFEVKADSVDTGNARRDGHLKSPDFFNVAEHPTITFKSTKVERKGDNRLAVTGDLSLHGVTKPITAEIQTFPGKQTQQGYKSGFEATFTIKRTDFDMDTYVANGGLGDEVSVIVAVEGARKNGE